MTKWAFDILVSDIPDRLGIDGPTYTDPGKKHHDIALPV